MGIGDNWPIWDLIVMTYNGTDPTQAALIDTFNWYFSITFEMGCIAFLFTLVCVALARS
jgi:hypothetical protein